MSATQGTDQESLQDAYGVFKAEVTHHAPHYAPKSVTTDGWEATHRAWLALFPGIRWILCFLHEVLKVKDRCRSNSTLSRQLQDKLWQVYQGATKREFAQRLRRLIEWAAGASLPVSIAKSIKRLKAKSKDFQVAYEFEGAYRTSNQVDRPMNYLDRVLYAMQYFHGNVESVEQSVRSIALLWNFHPYCRKTQVAKRGCISPFEEFNGFRYHDDWFRNFLIASSLNGRRPLDQKH
ncbi:hypothetical protein [Lyngbya confervoides]|uniref:Transposase n=1 Tax=Lyngbya confervoides BDU141951 TaxID=1574623 RepID=A0ABD4SXI0_9CYAN|nr:hypothetical protein [Lyngbya confervoides]MCM1981294.1 hypothetical protein [Lyngbya confervoides BDU141951]